MSKTCLFLLFLFFQSSVFAQTFEGSITYKVEYANPAPEYVPDSAWQQELVKRFGPDGYLVQTYYYKENHYLSEVEIGRKKMYQLYNPEDKVLYNWVGKSDTAMTLDAKRYGDEFDKIQSSNETDTIMGIACKIITVTSQSGSMKIWYNSDFFRMDAKFYAGHKFGHWEKILEETKCLPLKMEQKSPMGNFVQTAIKFNEGPLADEKFKMPEFKVIQNNPIN